MYASTAMILAAIGGVAFMLTFSNKASSPGVFAALSLGVWGMLALGADSVTVIQNGSTVTAAQPSLQFVSFGLALVSGLAVVGAFLGN